MRHVFFVCLTSGRGGGRERARERGGFIESVEKFEFLSSSRAASTLGLEELIGRSDF